MPITVRGNIFMTCPDAQAGWSELFFFQAADISSAKVNLQTLANARSLLLGADSFVNAIRVSDEAIKRDSLIVVYHDNVLPKLPDVKNSAHPFDAFLIRLNASAQYRRPLYLRGFPIDQWTEPPSAGTPDWDSAYNDWITTLINGQFSVRVLDQTAPNQYQQIAETSKPGPLVNIQIPGHGYSSGDTVLLVKTGIRALDRQWKITVVDADNFTLDKSNAVPVPAPVAMLGRCRRVVYQYPTITSVQYIGDTHRVCGRPFGTPRGRKKQPTP